MDHLLIYFVSILDTLSDTIVALTIVSGIITGGFIFTYIVDHFKQNEYQKMKGLAEVGPLWCKRLLFIFGILLFLSICIPTTKQAAIIYCLPKIANNEQVQKIPDKILKLSNEWLDELSPNNTKEEGQ